MGRSDPWMRLSPSHPGRTPGRTLDQQPADADAGGQVQDRLMATLGHELRNPLSTIRRALEVMRALGNDSYEQAVIERQVRYMIRLVEDLLDATRGKSGKLALSKQRVDVAAVVRNAVETVSALLQERRQHVEVRVPADLCAMLDESRMRQVVSNLLDNAAKYSALGSRIVVVGERQANTLRLKVVDEGMGIDATMLEQIFDAFTRWNVADNGAVGGLGGLGIGLSIVRSIVELHGGCVHARSPGPGRGSEFIIEIPVCE